MSNLDLIIPTFNRPEFLSRILDYYNNYNVDYNIIIADSSSTANKIRNKKVIALFPKLNISYIKFSSKLPSHIKFGIMVKKARSKYVCFCPDDDFIIPNGIDAAVKFLEKNPDYATAHGTYISFYLYKGFFGIKLWWRFIYPFTTINSSSPLVRLINHLKSYYQVLWAVRRTEVAKKSYKEFLKSKVNPYLFGELLPDMLTLIFGKMKRLNTLYSARQAFSTSYSYWPSLLDSRKTKVYDQEYDKFKKCLTTNLAKFGFSKSESSNIIDLKMKAYLKTTIQEHLTGRINLILKRLPPSIDKFVRLLHVKYLFSKTSSDPTGAINHPSSKYFDDFNTLRKIIFKHNI